MCGICGEINFLNKPVNKADVKAMLSRLQRRGPDSEGEYYRSNVALGHRRLSIIDLSERANQPMVDESKQYAIVFNGTIYNYPILRQQLIDKGYHFNSRGDTEVILQAYKEWGESCVERLQGMFAFAIWDDRKQRLFLARDRLGIKPLYYAPNPQQFRFASNTQALLATGNVNTDIDEVALHHQFTLHAVIPAPRTIYKGIRKLSPGHMMSVSASGKIETRAYWKLSSKLHPPRHEIMWLEAVHEALKNAVQKRKLIADVPVGVLLSGGLDSSLLVGLLAEAGVSDIRTFSIGFEDVEEEKGSEFEYSDQIADRFGTLHHKFRIPNHEVLSRLPEAVSQMAEPMFGQDAVAFYLLSEQVAKQVKVVQSGQGADEVFGGYFWYEQMHKATGADIMRFANHYFDRDHAEYLQMVDAAYQGTDHTRKLVAKLLQQCDADDFVNRVMMMDASTLIVDDPVKRVDNMTMAWGLEARVPFLDHELVELAVAMPPEIKLKNAGKHPLKWIARGLLPDSVIDRPKAYFPMPALKYVRGEFLHFMQDILNSQACRERQLYDRRYVDKLLSQPEAHFTRIKGSKLWHLALLELWLQTNHR